jgi:hypothetical protein
MPLAELLREIKRPIRSTRSNEQNPTTQVHTFPTEGTVDKNINRMLQLEVDEGVGSKDTSLLHILRGIRIKGENLK